MSGAGVHICSFSGDVADLKPVQRTESNVIEALRQNPRVSTWDMEKKWLRQMLNALEAKGRITLADRSYPWNTYKVIENDG